MPAAPAVKCSVPTCMPADVGLPRNHSADPVKAGGAVIIGIHDVDEPLAVTSNPCAMSGSAFTTSMVTSVAWPTGQSKAS